MSDEDFSDPSDEDEEEEEKEPKPTTKVTVVVSPVVTPIATPIVTPEISEISRKKHKPEKERKPHGKDKERSEPRRIAEVDNVFDATPDSTEDTSKLLKSTAELLASVREEVNRILKTVRRSTSKDIQYPEEF